MPQSGTGMPLIMSSSVTSGGLQAGCPGSAPGVYPLPPVRTPLGPPSDTLGPPRFLARLPYGATFGLEMAVFFTLFARQMSVWEGPDGGLGSQDGVLGRVLGSNVGRTGVDPPSWQPGRG